MTRTLPCRISSGFCGTDEKRWRVALAALTVSVHADDAPIAVNLLTRFSNGEKQSVGSHRTAPFLDRPHVDLLGGSNSLYGPGADDLLLSGEKLGRKPFGGVFVRKISHMKRRRIIRCRSAFCSVHVPFIRHDLTPNATHYPT